MAYLQDLLRTTVITQPTGQNLGLPLGDAYASYYPSWEVTTPRYPFPNSYSLAQAGWRTNEVVYALISKRAKARAEAPLWVYKNDDEHPIEQPQHEIRKLLKAVNQGIGEKMFWQISSISRDIAGFFAWEIETNNIGEPIKLWFMRPDWCSFLRGEQKPLRAIRYQPYGLPPQDIPIERVLFHGDFDIQYPQILFYSPTMNALKQIGVDNSMTDFLVDFVKRGAKFSGLLSVAQTIDDNQAADIRRRFAANYGGAGAGWANVGVMGDGVKYENMQMNFNDMAFPELDARTETRICMSFEMSPILISAKVGINASTYNNYKEAHKAWYNEWVNPDWQIVSDNVGAQLLPRYHDNPQDYYCEFNTNKVKALQEDQDAVSERAVKLAGANIISRNRALEMVGDDPVDFDDMGNPIDVYVGLAKNSGATGQVETTEMEKPEPSTRPETMGLPAKVPGATPTSAALEEIKKFKVFAKRRIKEGKAHDIAQYEFKSLPQADAEALIRQYDGPVIIAQIERALRSLEREAA